MQGTEEQRFWRKIKISDSGCWEWTGGTASSGYGRISQSKTRKMISAHRWVYEHCIGEIPEGLTIDHLCRNRKCVNPLHLEAVPLADNVLRGFGLAANNKRKTLCKYGHPLVKKKFYPRHRYCRICARLRYRRLYEQKTGRKCPERGPYNVV